MNAPIDLFEPKTLKVALINKHNQIVAIPF